MKKGKNSRAVYLLLISCLLFVIPIAKLLFMTG